MEQGNLSWITGYIWGIADDVLRDLYVRGKYRDVILPMTVLRRFDAVLEDSKQAVLDMKSSLDKAGVVEQDQALRQASGQAFYNTSNFKMRDLKARASFQQLKADFEAYLDGFSPNVQDILENFEFRNQIPRLTKADAHWRRSGARLQSQGNQGPQGDRRTQRRRSAGHQENLQERPDPDPMRGIFETTIKGKPAVVEYEPDTDLRDTEQIPLTETGGIEAFIKREVLPYAADAWYKADSVKTSYEISFTRYFYKPQPMRTLQEIRADILALEKETDGLLDEIIGGVNVCFPTSNLIP